MKYLIGNITAICTKFAKDVCHGEDIALSLADSTIEVTENLIVKAKDMAIKEAEKAGKYKAECEHMQKFAEKQTARIAYLKIIKQKEKEKVSRRNSENASRKANTKNKGA